MNSNQLIDLIKTEKDRTRLLDLLDQVSQEIFRVKPDPLRLINSDQEFGKALADLLPSDFSTIHPVSAQKEIERIIKLVNLIPTVQIIVAASPTDTTMQSLISFVKEKTSEKSILEVKVDPQILGGAIFIINGKYIDLSVAHKLENAFDTKNGVNLLVENN